MNFHAFIEWLKYTWRAKDLHGVHSPFAYDFNEKVLRNHAKTAKVPATESINWLEPKYNKLLNDIFIHYGYTTVHYVQQDDESEPAAFDMLVMKNDVPGHWVRLFNKYAPTLKSNCAIVIDGIHRTKRHTAKWERLHKHPKVMLSIDLFGVGLLFFRPEFKEKQHFVLKY